MNATLSIIGLYNYDETLFDNMLIPDGVDTELVVNTILSNYGNLEVLYPSVPFMKTMIGLWSRKELPIWQRLKNTMDLEYNPIENYDRQETWTDTRNLQSVIDGELKNTGTNTNVVDGEQANTGTDTTKVDNEQNTFVRGFNDATLINNGKTTDDDTQVITHNTRTEVDTTTTDTLNTKQEQDTTTTDTGNITHSGRVHGNIGVTTSQQMLSSELELAPRLNIIDYIVDSFKNRFCIMVY